MEFDLSKIKFSNSDLKNNICIPKRLTPKLAEFIGVVIGDGHVGCYKNRIGKPTYTHYEIRISGNIKDYSYYSGYVNNLTYELFNIRFELRKHKSEKSVTLSKDSKALFYFLSECVNIPKRKDNIRVPKQIRNGSLSIKSSFLRGLADADFTFTLKNKEGKIYPVVQGSSKSKALITDVCLLLEELNLKYSTFLEKSYYKKRQKLYAVHRIYLNGNNNVEEWFSKVGFSNLRHIIRFREFMKRTRA